MPLKHDWQVKAGCQRGENGWSYRLKQVSLSDESSRKWHMCERKTKTDRRGGGLWLRHGDQANVQLVSTGPWTDSARATCFQQGLKHNVVHYL